jgi:hypothetical protein
MYSWCTLEHNVQITQYLSKMCRLLYMYKLTVLFMYEHMHVHPNDIHVRENVHMCVQNEQIATLSD